jgi:hemerythrin-like domain-containing protein
MTPTEILKHEHKIVLLVLEGAEREAKIIQEKNSVHAEKIESLVDFFRNFTDRCHHGKEEKHLFVKMQERGMPGDTGPIAVMLHEHQEGRKKVAAMAEALIPAKNNNTSAIASVKENLFAYIELLRAHIDKEDNILFPMADQLFTAQDKKELMEAFEKVEAEEMGEGVHEKYHQLAHDLAKG